MLKKVLFGLMLLLLSVVSPAQKPTQRTASGEKPGPTPIYTRLQSRSHLEKERSAIQQEINRVKRSLGQTQRHHRESLAQLALLQQQLSLRESAIRNINRQVSSIRTTMDESGQQSQELQGQLDSLRSRYADNIVLAYKNRNQYSYLSFIFSASSFNDALTRIQYLRSYDAYRAEQTERLYQAERLLQEKIDRLRSERLEKEEVLKKETSERIRLGEEKKEKETVVTHLRSQEKKLEERVADRQRQDRKLSAAIAAIIIRAKNTPIHKGLPAVSNADHLPVTVGFERSRGHLPWPVDSGSILQHFGFYVYGGNLQGNNQGLTIAVAAGSPVKTVFDGEIQAVFQVGEVEAVMIRHGHYFTTYSNLSTVAVTRGEQVKTGQVIGRVGEIHQLEFLISDEKDHMFDPEKWLRR